MSGSGSPKGVRRSRLLLVLLCVTALAAAAGTEAAAPPLHAQLAVSFWPKGQGKPGLRTWTVRCGPVGGTHPRATAACARLAKLGDQKFAAFAPTPPTQACSMIYGGPQRARVRGTLDGRRIDARFSRVNGCEIARWQRLVPLLPSPGRWASP